MMIVEYARNVCGLEDADTYEMNPASKSIVIHKLEEIFKN